MAAGEPSPKKMKMEDTETGGLRKRCRCQGMVVSVLKTHTTFCLHQNWDFMFCYIVAYVRRLYYDTYPGASLLMFFSISLCEFQQFQSLWLLGVISFKKRKYDFWWQVIDGRKSLLVWYTSSAFECALFSPPTDSHPFCHFCTEMCVTELYNLKLEQRFCEFQAEVPQFTVLDNYAFLLVWYPVTSGFALRYRPTNKMPYNWIWHAHSFIFLLSKLYCLGCIVILDRCPVLFYFTQNVFLMRIVVHYG